MCNKSYSSITVPRTFVIETAQEGLTWITATRKRLAEEYIAREMQKKRFFGLGRNYTREEAEKRMWGDDDIISSGWEFCTMYNDAESKFKNMLRAIEVADDETWMTLSVDDAAFFQKWRECQKI